MMQKKIIVKGKTKSVGVFSEAKLIFFFFGTLQRKKKEKQNKKKNKTKNILKGKRDWSSKCATVKTMLRIDFIQPK